MSSKKSVAVVAMGLFVLLCVAFTGSDGFAQISPQYANTPYKDFMADAPWRVKGVDTPIPFGFFIKDCDTNTLQELNSVEIYVNGNRIYFHDFQKIPISQSFWEWSVNRFENAYDGTLNGKSITARNLGFKKGDIISFDARINGKEMIGTVSFRRVLRVAIQGAFPRPDSHWFYGDAHFHTQYTNNPYEWGSGLLTTKRAIKAMGLDWVTTTDHASDNGWWDLNATRWNALRRGWNALPFIIGEEITCQPVAGLVQNGIHLLVYNNDAFISGAMTSANNARFSLESRLQALNNNAVAFAAHPSDETDAGMWLFGNIKAWSSANYQTALSCPYFFGLEVWNTRATSFTDDIDGDAIDPFTGSNGGWQTALSISDKRHFRYGLTKSITQWDTLLREKLPTLGKVFIDAGSDAHGDLNYMVQRNDNISQIYKLIANDNAMGKVRTLVYAPEYTQGAILDGIRKGHSLITDGPVLLTGLDLNGDHKLSKADGDLIMGDTLEIKTTPANAEIFVSWMANDGIRINTVRLYLDGTLIHTFSPKRTVQITQGNAFKGYLLYPLKNIPPGNHYVRAECVTDGVTTTFGDKDYYRAYTNPIWLSVAAPAAHYTDNSNGTIMDNKTGLMWQQADDGVERYWDDASNHCCQDLRLGGYSDWRLPRVDELRTIVDYTRYKPAIDPVFNGRSGDYWSSSTYAGYPDDAWSVHFYYGYVNANYKTYSRFYVRCVRGGPFWPFDPSNILQANTANTVKDTYRGYVWQKSDDGVTRGWEGAKSYCYGLDLDNYSDWRLPTIEELQTIIDYTTYDPALSTEVIQGRSYIYWSSSTHAYDPYSAWAVDFYDGFVSWVDKIPSSILVRCVRGGPF